VTQDKRFLQLGLALHVPSGYGCSVDSIFTQPLPCAIPFDIKDESLGVWEDTPPSRDWVIGSSPSNVSVDSSSIVRRRTPFNDFSGWAGLRSVSRITIYGDMKGIRFNYSGDAPDIFFGCVDDETDTVIQEINQESGEKVVGVAVLAALYGGGDDAQGSTMLSNSSQTTDGLVPMERIFVSWPIPHTHLGINGLSSSRIATKRKSPHRSSAVPSFPSILSPLSSTSIAIS